MHLTRERKVTYEGERTCLLEGKKRIHHENRTHFWETVSDTKETHTSRHLSALHTFHLFHTSQGVLEGVQCGSLVIVFLLSRQMKLQFFQSFNYFLLGLGFGRLLTTAIQTVTHAVESQMLQQIIRSLSSIKRKLV